ncbi:MAG: aminotransferase class V-fold PLP-dependent enzyme, partial [Bacteroidota bacterium]
VSMVFLSSSFKWLLAGYGVAIGYVSQDLLPRFKAFQGWNSIDFGSGMAKTGAASLEVGNAMFFNVLGLHEGLKMILALGLDHIFQKNLAYREELIEALRGIGKEVIIDPNSRSTIFKVAAEKEDYQKMVARQIQSSQQKETVRLSPHFYNNDEDIQQLVACLEE